MGVFFQGSGQTPRAGNGRTGWPRILSHISAHRARPGGWVWQASANPSALLTR